MKNPLCVTASMAVVLLAACTKPPAPSALTAVAPPASTPASSAAEQAQVRELVRDFGKRLGQVSLLAPDAAQEIKTQYSEFVSPDLLETWMNDPQQAPGRLVSSPWPDRIEITALTKETPDRYVITGSVIEITSVELVNGGAAAKIPVRIVAGDSQGHWLITEYAEAR